MSWNISYFRYPNNYRLIIQNIKKEDRGVYVCQIASFPPKALTVTINVIGKFYISFSSEMQFYSHLDLFFRGYLKVYVRQNVLFGLCDVNKTVDMKCQRKQNLIDNSIDTNSIAVNAINLKSTITFKII